MAGTNNYDLSLLEQLDDKSALLDVLDLFLKDTPEQVRQLALSTRAGEWESVSELAHKLKGSLSMLQAKSLVNQLASIEKTAKSAEDKTPIAGWVVEVEATFEVFRAELTKEVNMIRKEIG
ncbi:HPt (histidine-containing phosphotransfer) domain-containing protein [Hydrobacter penzbergensis]|uniref:HPt (Histidine-containing phosphotransfer) domain-containing protein n=1 Tax=Hydrobacter penzbergensis TaxID=1235997 RepID=A0A8X8IH84_9BACT|nr:Hpt domain-containing protein [Hydrobacter penzbergensis]SDX35151.1 HPt (histidine-containing phosphotransfer) domain-containing protein [Hydrobacter penzbergensis]